MNLSASRLKWHALRKVQARRSRPSGVVPVALANENAVGIELVGQSLSLAESTALTPLHSSKTLLEPRILATSWPRIFFHARKASAQVG